MKKLICILLCCASLYQICAQNSNPAETSPTVQNNETISDPAKVTIASYFIAGGEVVLSNLTLFLYNRFITHASFAYVTLDSIKANLTNPWVWDQDEFQVNQLGHPYQGSVYYSAARANGLNFWLAGLYTAFGSITWELFCETERPSINDLIITTTGGMMMGEMFHRLYSEAAANNSWWAFIVNPMEAFNELVTRKKNREESGKIQSLSYHVALSSGFTKVYFEPSAQRSPQTDWYYANLGGGLSIIYGQPYGLRTNTPYDHFELDLHGEWSPSNFQLVFASNGMLFSYDTGSTEKIQNSLGMSMHCDVIYSKKMDFASHGVGFTMKEQIMLPYDWNIRWALHANWILLGGSEFYYYLSGEVPNTTGNERRLYDFGTGAGAKADLIISHPYAGTLSLKYMLHAVFSLKKHIATDGSPGHTIINSITGQYSHMITKRYSLGISATLFIKNGIYKNQIYPDITQYNFMSSIFFAVHLK